MLDFSTLKTLSIEGIELKTLSLNGTQIWKKPPSYTNQVPISVDTDGSIFNKTGYKDNVRLSSSGGVSSSAQNGSTTTGFIPWYGDTTYLRVKGVEWLNATANYGGHFYVNCYDTNKKFLDYLATAELGNYAHIVTVTRDSNGIETIKFSETYGTANTKLQCFRKAAFIRITARGKGADMILTINEEIE